MRFQVPTSSINFIVDKYHVSTPDDKIRADIRQRVATRQRTTNHARYPQGDRQTTAAHGRVRGAASPQEPIAVQLCDGRHAVKRPKPTPCKRCQGTVFIQKNNVNLPSEDPTKTEQCAACGLQR